MPRHERKFARKVPRALKARSGRTRVNETPLRILLSDVELREEFGRRARALLGRRLGRFATHIERVTVRIVDVSNQRGGAAAVCRIKLTVSGRPSVLVEGRGPDAEIAFARAAASVVRAMERAIERAGMPTPVPTHPLSPRRRAERPAPASRPEGGSFIGRRVGRAHANLRRAARRPRGRRDEWVDTSLPGTSASDRKAGQGSTAARNTRLRMRGMGYTLEDSARERPSRKSTRKSANRAKSGSKLARRQRRRTHAPKTRAKRAASASR